MQTNLVETGYKTPEKILKRGLGNFELTETDLIESIVERKRTELVESHQDTLQWEDVSPKEIIKKIYSGAEGFREYNNKRSKRNCAKETRDNIPFGIAYPKICILLFLVPIFFISYLFGVIFNHSFESYAGLIFSYLGLSIPVIITSVIALKTFYFHAWHDLKLFGKFQGKINACYDKIEEELKKFCYKLETDNDFYLDNLIEELNAQKASHVTKFNKIGNDLMNLVEQPRKAAKLKIRNLNSQIKQTPKLKELYAAEDVEKIKADLIRKKEKLTESIKNLSPLELLISQKMQKVKTGLKSMDSTITKLVEHKESTTDVNKLMTDIRSSLGDGYAEWGYIEQSKYNRDLTKILNELDELEESMEQITTATCQAAGILSAGEERLALNA